MWIHLPCGGRNTGSVGRGPCQLCLEMPDRPQEVVELRRDTVFTGDPSAPARQPLTFQIAVQVEVSPDAWDLHRGTGTLPEAVREDVAQHLGAIVRASGTAQVTGLRVHAAYPLVPQLANDSAHQARDLLEETEAITTGDASRARHEEIDGGPAVDLPRSPSRSGAAVNSNSTEPGIPRAAYDANQMATFHPFRPAVGPDGTPGYPCTEVAGCHVYAYVDPDEAVLRVSLHVDTASRPLIDPDGADGACVPVEISVGGTDPLWTADRDGAERYPAREAAHTAPHEDEDPVRVRLASLAIAYRYAYLATPLMARVARAAARAAVEANAESIAAAGYGDTAAAVLDDVRAAIAVEPETPRTTTSTTGAGTAEHTEWRRRLVHRLAALFSDHALRT